MVQVVAQGPVASIPRSMPISRDDRGCPPAMTLSGVPFQAARIGAVRVGYLDGQYVITPTLTADPRIRMSEPGWFAGTAQGCADGRVRSAGTCRKTSCSAPWCIGHEQMQAVDYPPSRKLAEVAGQAPPGTWKAPAKDEALGGGKSPSKFEGELRKAFDIRQKGSRPGNPQGDLQAAYIESCGVRHGGGPDAKHP